MSMIQLWIEVSDRADHIRLEQRLRENGFAFFDPQVATSETLEEIESRLCPSCHARNVPVGVAENET